jgi:Uma2 family endonuclease
VRTSEIVAQRRFTVKEYHRLAETGILRPDERVELVRGIILTKARKSRAHVISTKLIHDLLSEALRGMASVYHGAPLIAERIDSEPEPDIMVCSNPDPWAYGTSRTKPLLIIEVADHSLDYDLGEKATLYADAEVPEYWVVNLVERVLIVFREPLKGNYQVRLSVEETTRVAAEPWPELAFEVSAFFPPESPTPSE